jgi:hypothetical protein
VKDGDADVGYNFNSGTNTLAFTGDPRPTGASKTLNLTVTLSGLDGDKTVSVTEAGDLAHNTVLDDIEDEDISDTIIMDILKPALNETATLTGVNPANGYYKGDVQYTVQFTEAGTGIVKLTFDSANKFVSISTVEYYNTADEAGTEVALENGIDFDYDNAESGSNILKLKSGANPIISGTGTWNLRITGTLPDDVEASRTVTINSVMDQVGRTSDSPAKSASVNYDSLAPRNNGSVIYSTSKNLLYGYVARVDVKFTEEGARLKKITFGGDVSVTGNTTVTNSASLGGITKTGNTITLGNAVNSRTIQVNYLSFTPTALPIPGTLSVTLKFEDALGNESEEFTLEKILDPTPPAVTSLTVVTDPASPVNNYFKSAKIEKYKFTETGDTASGITAYTWVLSSSATVTKPSADAAGWVIFDDPDDPDDWLLPTTGTNVEITADIPLTAIENPNQYLHFFLKDNMDNVSAFTTNGRYNFGSARTDNTAPVVAAAVVDVYDRTNVISGSYIRGGAILADFTVTEAQSGLGAYAVTVDDTPLAANDPAWRNTEISGIAPTFTVSGAVIPVLNTAAQYVYIQ